MCILYVCVCEQIADFGLSKWRQLSITKGSSSKPAEMGGTVIYMPPEEYEPSKSRRTDVKYDMYRSVSVDLIKLPVLTRWVNFWVSNYFNHNLLKYRSLSVPVLFEGASPLIRSNVLIAPWPESNADSAKFLSDEGHVPPLTYLPRSYGEPGNVREFKVISWPGKVMKLFLLVFFF